MKKGSFIGKFLIIAATATALVQTASAQILPEVFDAFFQDNVVDTAFNRVQVGFLILLGGFLALVVFYIIRALMKYASKDTSDDLGEATKIMQRNMIAVGGVFIGVIGIAVVLIFFGINPDMLQPHQICINYPQSYGCHTCTKNPSTSTKKDDYGAICDLCDTNEEAQLGGGKYCYDDVEEGATLDEIEEILDGTQIE